MSLLRSDTMGYFNIVIPRESAWEVLNELGNVESVEFLDQNSNESHLSRPFTPAIKRTEEVLNHIASIQADMMKYKKDITRCEDVPRFL